MGWRIESWREERGKKKRIFDVREIFCFLAFLVPEREERGRRGEKGEEGGRGRGEPAFYVYGQS